MKKLLKCALVSIVLLITIALVLGITAIILHFIAADSGLLALIVTSAGAKLGFVLGLLAWSAGILFILALNTLILYAGQTVIGIIDKVF